MMHINTGIFLVLYLVSIYDYSICIYVCTYVLGMMRMWEGEMDLRTDPLLGYDQIYTVV